MPEVSNFTLEDALKRHFLRGEPVQPIDSVQRYRIENFRLECDPKVGATEVAEAVRDYYSLLFDCRPMNVEGSTATLTLIGNNIVFVTVTVVKGIALVSVVD